MYDTWFVGDILQICVKVEDFCGFGGQTIYLGNGDIQKYPAPCNISCHATDCADECLDTSGKTIWFKSVLNNHIAYNDVNCENLVNDRVYHELGSVNTDSRGIATLVYQVTQQDLQDYLDSVAQGKPYNIVCCMSGSLALQSHAVTFSGITIQPSTGAISVSSTPSGAGVFYDSETTARGVTPLQLTNVPSGHHTITLKLAGYQDDVQSVTVETGQTVTLNVTLSRSTETHYIYFGVPRVYETGYVTSKLASILDAAVQALGSGYDIHVDFDPDRYIVTVTVSKTGVQQAVIPVLVVLALLIIAAVGAILPWFYMWFMGSKSVTDEQPSTRVITINPKICIRNETSGNIDCSPPTAQRVVVVEYTIDKETTVVEVADGTPVTFSAPTNVDIVLTARVKDNTYYNIWKETIPKGTTNEERDAVFIATADFISFLKSHDSAGQPTCGKYLLLEQASDGNYVVRSEGTLDADGKAPKFSGPADKVFCVQIIPCDYTTHSIEMKCMKPGAGETVNIDVPVYSCAEAKNAITVRTVYVSTDGTRNDTIADKVEVFVGNDVVASINPTTNISVIKGLQKGTSYSVHVTKAGYTILNNDLEVSFTTDCFDIKPLTIEANPPAGSSDVTFTVRDCRTSTTIKGANVSLDSGISKKTDETGSVFLTAIPPGDHKLVITSTAYKELSETITITTSGTITKCLDADQVFQDVETRINGLSNKGDLVAGKAVRFTGSLEYKDTDGSFKPLTDATVIVSIKDSTGKELKSFTVTSQSGLLSNGYFETGDWIASSTSSVDVCASFAGVGRYKQSSSCNSYAIDSGCWIQSPTGGCMLSAKTGQTIAIIGGVIVGGYVVYKVFTRKK